MPGTIGGTTDFAFMKVCAKNFGPAPKVIPALPRPGKLGTFGNCNLGILGRDGSPRDDPTSGREGFGIDIGNPAALANVDAFGAGIVGTAGMLIAEETAELTADFAEETTGAGLMEKVAIYINRRLLIRKLYYSSKCLTETSSQLY